MLPAILSVAGLFLVMIVVARFQGTPVFTPPEFLVPEHDRPAQPDASLGEPGMPDFSSHSELNPLLTAIVSNIVMVIGIGMAVAVGIGILWLVVRTVTRLWSQRRLRKRAGASLAAVQDGASSEERASAAVQSGIVEALQDIEDHMDPGEAIVAAWMGLEQSARRAGFVRSVSETPMEFTRRIIVRAAGSAAEVDSLLRLYERVRFGGYIADEGDRARARDALRSIQEVRG